MDPLAESDQKRSSQRENFCYISAVVYLTKGNLLDKLGTKKNSPYTNFILKKLTYPTFTIKLFQKEHITFLKEMDFFHTMLKKEYKHRH